MSACSTCKFYSSGQFSNRCELDGSEYFITPETCYMKDKIDKERSDAIDEFITKVDNSEGFIIIPEGDYGDYKPRILTLRRIADKWKEQKEC